MKKVEIKLRKGVLILTGIGGIGYFLFFILFSLYLKVFRNETLLPQNKMIYIIICFFVVIIAIFFYLPNIRKCIDGSGVSATRKLKIAGFVFFESNHLLEWNSIESFVYRSMFGLYYGGFYCIDRENKNIVIKWRYSNYNEAVELIAVTLSQIGKAKIDQKIIKKITQWKLQGKI